ncbi:MAG TPA: DUF4097 family beta strand repeat-containing protein [Vicinamibacterales bacterium]|nr:DUF4097 family beta strand repeat-containing protein [Vicinamibacterales bacterium]
MHSIRLRAGLLPALLVAAAIVSAGCDVKMAADGDFSVGMLRGQARDTWTRSYPVAPGGSLEIINVNGQITAEASTGATVEVSAERSVSASSDEAAQEILAKIEMREEVGVDRVRVEPIAPRVRLGSHKVTFIVKVPDGVHVNLRTVNGGVRLENVGGEVRAASTNGGVRGRVAAASFVEASTTNGGVDLELTGVLAPEGRLMLTSVNGGIQLKVPEDTQAQVRARCTNGRIRVNDLPFVAEGEQNRRRVDGTLNGGGARIELQTTNGGVSLSRS